jgi:hypothetical protein
MAIRYRREAMGQLRLMDYFKFFLAAAVREDRCFFHRQQPFFK